ncbi:class I SAM-dependent methyltransferase [Chitinimonas sp.]|uniref:class I SAM-dependent methyltransferase n=1 Tax=Chitinimonas sp. TaxID=1934313 RepID=UPI0035B009B4
MNIMANEEKSRLDAVAMKSVYDKGANAAGIRYGYKVASRFIKYGATLELGPAEGLMTELLCSVVPSLTCVDGSELFCKELKKKFPNVFVINSLFEDLFLESKFLNIILGHVLEHVNDPVVVLERIKQFLLPQGVIFAAVPNARSLHRQAAVEMGILDSEHALNEMDIHHGHRRVFDPESFRQVFIRAGLKVDFFGGYWLKPVSNGQIERDWDGEMIGAFMKLGERYPDVAAEIYVVASLPGESS